MRLYKNKVLKGRGSINPLGRKNVIRFNQQESIKLSNSLSKSKTSFSLKLCQFIISNTANSFIKNPLKKRDRAKTICKGKGT